MPKPRATAAIPATSATDSSAAPLFKRLRQLLSRNEPATPAQIEAAIAELAQTHAAAAAAARATRAAHEHAVLDMLASEDEEQLAASRREAAGAAAHEAELASALTGLKSRLAQLRAQAAADELRAHWSKAEAALGSRARAIARLQAAADAYAGALEATVQATDAVWAALPLLPAHRPPTYGRDLYARAALYLYGVSEGKSGGAMASASSAYVARRRPDLVALDAGARQILLMPFEQLREGTAEAL
jgi:hypothetical protein